MPSALVKAVSTVRNARPTRALRRVCGRGPLGKPVLRARLGPDCPGPLAPRRVRPSLRSRRVVRYERQR